MEHQTSTDGFQKANHLAATEIKYKRTKHLRTL